MTQIIYTPTHEDFLAVHEAVTEMEEALDKWELHRFSYRIEHTDYACFGFFKDTYYTYDMKKLNEDFGDTFGIGVCSVALYSIKGSGAEVYKTKHGKLLENILKILSVRGEDGKYCPCILTAEDVGCLQELRKFNMGRK